MKGDPGIATHHTEAGIGELEWSRYFTISHVGLNKFFRYIIDFYIVINLTAQFQGCRRVSLWSQVGSLSCIDGATTYYQGERLVLNMPLVSEFVNKVTARRQTLVSFLCA
ncbi:hypothetical protein [Gallaecimonas pentaromativorans]|uniref:hypothetical protein n=1 Tax=Gallaecimonas pentaromativorans TaxID=584787 RepID=UPI0011CD71F5|nr:hypothetical protein [Gallaecimonas pentaromativorans]